MLFEMFYKYTRKVPNYSISFLKKVSIWAPLKKVNLTVVGKED
jgi:hypothetical protein